MLIKALTLLTLFAPLLAANPLMPTPKDHTKMWWSEGFPNNNPGAPWLRVIETGNYRFALNTETLEIPELGKEKTPAKLELSITADGTTYTAAGGSKWSRFTGPRLIASGHFFQRIDVTDLTFLSPEGKKLSTEASLEVAAWPDRLGLSLIAKPGIALLKPGRDAFGKIGGGFGLDAKSDFTIPHAKELDPAQFTLEFWAYIPADHQAGKHSPWLVCKNRNEASNGNFGIMLVNGKAVALMNIDGSFRITSRPVNIDAWNKFSLSYDGDTMRFHLNNKLAGEQKIGKPRKPGRHALAFGRREDNHGDGYPFRGIIDGVKLFDHTVSKTKPVRHWGFLADGRAQEKPARASWTSSQLDIRLKSEKGTLHQQSSGKQAFLSFNPSTFSSSPPKSPLVVKASGHPVTFEPALGWHRINLDQVKPIGKGNNVIDRVHFTLSNPTDREEIARLAFEKSRFPGRLGSAITGVTAILCDADGHPTGIPVQLSKNWHRKPEAGTHQGPWFHGITQLRLPPGAKVDLQIVIANGHWGGVAAASHAQLSLIGWGTNTLWDQSALGSWGESICYDPSQTLANSTITDVRPLMVTPKGGKGQWNWTNNIGGGDFFRLYQPDGKRTAHSAMRATYHKIGPCLTEVTYEGKLTDGISHQATVSLGRTDDLVRGTYRIRLDVEKATDFSRFIIFQVGSDTYNFTTERKMAIGTADGLTKEWNTQWGSNTYRTETVALSGTYPWASLHQGVPDPSEKGAIANRGFIIREWKARLGGKDTAPFIAERGLSRGRTDSSTLDLLPPPGITRLEPGDFIEATIEHLVIPQFAKDYYGPNQALRAALSKNENTWKMVHRETAGNARQIEVTQGTLVRKFPDIRIQTENNAATFTLTNGLGYVPLTFTGLKSHRGGTLTVNGQKIDQSIHGNDFWQSDFDPTTQTYSQTFNLPLPEGNTHTITFQQ
ncbi:MAG: hypothetical protein QNL77_04690 [Akkermansiaceae bacterium]